MKIIISSVRVRVRRRRAPAVSSVPNAPSDKGQFWCERRAAFVIIFHFIGFYCFGGENKSCLLLIQSELFYLMLEHLYGFFLNFEFSNSTEVYSREKNR